MTAIKRWNVSSGDGKKEIWEIHEDDEGFWCHIIDAERTLQGRAHFPTLEEATKFVLCCERRIEEAPLGEEE